MTTELKNHWVRVAFIVHCGEILERETSTYGGEPEWHRCAITEALACARARAEDGGDPSEPAYKGDRAIVVGAAYFDHYDVEALSSALDRCLVGTQNTAVEVEMGEADIFNAATAIAGLAMHVAFGGGAGDPVADAVSWMRSASEPHGKHAESCLELLVAAEKLLPLELDAPVPDGVVNLLDACKFNPG